MSHEAGKRERGNSLATTNGHPNAASSNDGGSMAAASGSVEETRSQSSVDISLEPQEYDMGSTSQPVGNPLPRNSSYAPTTTNASEAAAVKPRKRLHSLEPPVTKVTLSELDVNKIVHNPKLRHDINFDPELHFRPNLDGEKGRRKTEKANHFWETMRGQLRDYLTNRDLFEKEVVDTEWCLPATLKAIRGILETLVPQRDRSSVEETFNVELLMQQFRKGVADLVKLALWLSQLLKCHCAPMRDEWVDEMVTQISKGDREGDVALLVAGMKSLLAVLEAMKLDVANHQIRCLRPLLIEDTVHFEQKFFMKKIALGRVDVAGAHAWFRQASSSPDTMSLDASTHTQGNTWDFMKALVNLIRPSQSQESVPHTFLFDEERLTKLRSDMEDSINLEVCMHMFRGLEVSSRIQDTRSILQEDTPVSSFVASPCDRPASPAGHTLHSSPTLPLPHHFAPKSQCDITQERGYFIKTPAGRQLWIPHSESDPIATSVAPSPLSSPSSTASTSETYPPTPLYLSSPLSDSACQVRASLLALLSSASAPDRWTSLAPSLALQILRSTRTPLTRLPHFESILGFHLSNPRSRLYQEAELRVLSQLYPALQKLVEAYTPLTGLQIFEAATVPNIVGGLGVPTNGAREEIGEIATRIAHIGMLHWRVWAPLAYLIDPDGEEGDAIHQRATSMP